MIIAGPVGVHSIRMSSFTMLHIVTLALMAIGDTAQTLDSLATAGCVDQSAEFLSGLPNIEI